MRAAQAGDKAAVEALYREYRDRIRFFVLKNIPSKDAAPDIVSAAFLTAIEKLPELRCAEAFGSWLYSIAYSKCLQYLESESELARFDSDEEYESTVENALLNEPVKLPPDYLENEETMAQLREAIDSLKPEMRSAVIMYYFEEMNTAEVGQALGLSENAARQKLFQARKKLSSKLKKLAGGGITLCAVPLGAVFHAAFAGGKAARTAAVLKGGAAAKAAAIGAAAAVAVGVPAALGRLGDNGDHHPPEIKEERTEEPVPDKKELDDIAYTMLTDLENQSFDFYVENDDSELLWSGNSYDMGFAELMLDNSKYWNVYSCDKVDQSGCRGSVYPCTTMDFTESGTEISVVRVPTDNYKDKRYRLYLPEGGGKLICVEAAIRTEEQCPICRLWDKAEREKGGKL